MPYDDLSVKDLSITIQRGKHGKENPYVMISKKMLRDKELSPKAKGVLCYLLSLPDTWQVHPRQLAKSLGVGKNQIYSILKQLFSAGYATKKEIKDEKGRFGSVLYEFYEEKLPESERFKEKSTDPTNQGSVNAEMESVSQNPCPKNRDTENGTLENTEYIDERRRTPPIPPLSAPKKREAKDVSAAKAANAAKAAEVEREYFSQEKPTRKKNTAEFNADTRELGEKLVNILVRNKPNYVHPRNLSPFLTHVDYILRLDKRDAQLVEDVFAWAVADHFWTEKMYKKNPAEYLRQRFDQLELAMNKKPAPKERKFAPSSNDARSLAKMEEWEKSAL